MQPSHIPTLPRKPTQSIVRRYLRIRPNAHPLIITLLLAQQIPVGYAWALADRAKSLPLRITSNYAQTFTDSGRHAIILQGKVSAHCGTQQLSADKAVFWIKRDTDTPSAPVPTASQITVCLKDNARFRGKNIKVVTSTDDPHTVLLTFETAGEIFLSAQTRMDEPGHEYPLYQEALQQRQQFLPQNNSETPTQAQTAVGAPAKTTLPLATAAIGTAGPKTSSASAGETANTSAAAKPTEEKDPAQPREIPYRETEVHEPVRIVPQGRFISRHQPDGTDILTCTDGIYVYQRRPQENVLLELRAQNAVVFYSQKKLQEFSDRPKRSDVPQDANQAKPDESQILGQVVTGIYLEGDVVLQAGQYKITADKLYYDFAQDQALVPEGTLRMMIPERNVPLIIRAQRIRQLSTNHFSARNIKLSTDEFYQPHVWVGAQQADISAEAEQETAPADLGKIRRWRYDLHNVTTNLGDLPILWWPRLTGTTTKVEVPIKSVHTSYSSEHGVSVESAWYLARLLGLHEPQGVEATLRLDEFTERGPALGADLDYIQANYFGNLRSYLLDDHGEDRLGRFPARRSLEPEHPLRGRTRWQHRQYLPLDWQATVEVSYYSDPTFLESWQEREFDTEKEQETLLYFKQQRDNWAFDFLSKWRLNDFDYTLTELPTAGFHIAGQDIFEILTYYHDGYVGRFNERLDDRSVPGLSRRQEPSTLPGLLQQNDSTLAVSRHELALPVSLGPIRMIPTAIGTYVFDDSEMGAGLTSSINPPLHSNIENSLLQGALGLRASTQLWHVDDNVYSRLWDLDRMRHIVIPEVSTFWMESDLQDKPRNSVSNFALRQRWQTMRGPHENKHSADFLRFDSSITLVEHDVDQAPLPSKFFFSNPERQFGRAPIANADFVNLGLARREQVNQNYSDHVDADWTWLISDTTAVLGGLNYNLHDGVVSQANGAVAVQRSPRTSYYVSSLFLQNGDPFRQENANFITAGASYQLNRKYTVAAATQYDVQRNGSAYTQVVLIRKFTRWYGAFSFGYDADRNSISFSVSFWPEGLEDFALGSRRFTRLTR